MDEEENFARLLSASTPAPRPTLYSGGGGSGSEPDPWANPFGDNTTTSPWGGISTTTSFSLPRAPEPEPNEDEDESDDDERYPAPSVHVATASPTIPDPPSVIAAREREELASAATGGFADPYSSTFSNAPIPSDPYGPSPFASPPRARTSAPQSPVRPAPPSSTGPAAAAPPSPQHSRAIPAGLIDEDLLAENDPETSLKRAFKKSAAPAAPAVLPQSPEKSRYVFKPKPVAERRVDPSSIALPDSTEVSRTATPSIDAAAATTTSAEASQAAPPPAPVPPSAPAAAAPTQQSPVAVPTPHDRVSVSPLETPGTTESDYGFRSLAIGGASTDMSTRFGGRGWGAIDADDAPLVGAGGGDPWSDGNATADAWGGSTAVDADGSGAAGSTDAAVSAAAAAEDEDEDDEDDVPVRPSTESGPSASSVPSSPRRSKLLSTPVFQITVSDPTKVGDPVRGHIVYTVRTRTTSPHYRRGDFSVIRRFSDFLWLYEQLQANNPGVIVPPVPDKHAFGRFQDQFIETRRAALQRCLAKITSHPILQLDLDLRVFLESDSFAMEAKNRRAAGDTTPSSGLLASWTGPRYVEQDEWFDQRKIYLDHLESQLKGLAKSLDVASKARLDMATAVAEFGESITALAESDLGAAMCAALGRLAEIAKKQQTADEEQAKADVSQLLNLAEEYVRFIASVRLAFSSRVRSYHTWQAADKEVQRLRQLREKARQQGKLAERAANSMAEIQDAERRARDTHAEFDSLSKLVRAEFARFERERVDEFARSLSAHLDDQVNRQRELVTAWEDYHGMLGRMVARAQAQAQALAAANAGVSAATS